MLDALGAPGPRPGLAERLMLFGQFVGSWDVEVENISADGQVTRLKAEWHFGWALEGRAVMDVWIAPPRSEPSQTGRYEYGASLRYYDESIDAWRSTWIGPVRHLVRPFIARQVGSEIILEGSFEPGSVTRWMFSDVERNSFKWRNIESWDGGKTWTVVQRMVGVRST